MPRRCFSVACVLLALFRVKEQTMKKRNSPEDRFAQHKAQARRRGIGFSLTFTDWWALWEPHWHLRGTGSLDMCMCRRHDKGGYEVGNVRIATNRENKHEAAMERKVKHSQRPIRSREYRVSAIGNQVEWLCNRNVFTEYTENT